MDKEKIDKCFKDGFELARKISNMLYDEPSGITTTALAYCVTESIVFYETRGIMNKEEYKENFLSLVDELVEALYEGLENEQRNK